ncbi:hypothetical protein P3T36_006320 [Kitasatospora sp. MAP12-15]|uniref:hypothetical protein n=1 Tax=unclassified Kitasatospora TaxID=2633591 RepID=UPI002475BC3F|nr:hypothetical protein [Kitasatospora sp. MAP12-44]MDH6107862.1 hypothetical protein [Kitasatospora sp. MAP12-44]
MSRWGARSIVSLRRIHSCTGKAEGVIDGYRPAPGGEERLELSVHVCAAHDPAPAEWFAGLTTRVREDGTLIWDKCGLAMDFRGHEDALPMHAALWLTPLTGLDPADFDGWPAFLAAAVAHLVAQHDTAEGSWNAAAVFLEQAARCGAEGNLTVMLAALSHAETAVADALNAASPDTSGVST